MVLLWALGIGTTLVLRAFGCLHGAHIDLVRARVRAAFYFNALSFVSLHGVRVRDGPALAVIAHQRLAVLAHSAFYRFRAAALAHRALAALALTALAAILARALVSAAAALTAALAAAALAARLRQRDQWKRQNNGKRNTQQFLH